MKKRILSILVIFMFLFSNTALVYAKGSSHSSSHSSHSSSSVSRSSVKSSSSSSRSVTGSSSKSSGYSGSSSSKSSTSGSTGSSSKSSGYTGGSSSSSSTSGSTTTGSSGSSGYSGSSSSKSGSSGSVSSGSTGTGTSGSSTKSSGYTGSSGSSTKSSSIGTTSKTTSKTESLKNSYMADAYKKQTSSSNYSSYKQKLNDEQKKAYQDSMKSTYYSGTKMNFDDSLRTRTTRMNNYDSRPIRININTYHFGGPLSYGSAFAGPWDLWFLMRASDMFWYHHWSDIYPYRDYFEAAQFAEMESRIRQLEAQNIARDANYMEPDVDPDLMFSSDYQEQNVDKLYYTDKYSKPVQKPFSFFLPVLLISVGLIIMIYSLSRRKPQKPRKNTNGIY